MDTQAIWILLIGILLIVANRKTLTEVIKYYKDPKFNEDDIKFIDRNFGKVFNIVFLHLGLSFIFYVLIPKSHATFNGESPSTLFDAIGTYTMVAIMEEVLFRIAPWAVLAPARMGNSSKKMHKITAGIAIVVSLIFGLLHVTNYTNPDIWAYLLTVSQFTGGLLYWYLIDKSALCSPSFAHFYFNMIVWGISMIIT